jgi:hypothetical protein
VTVDDALDDVSRTRSLLEGEQRQYWENRLRRRARDLETAEQELCNARASNLGLHRAVFYNEQEGHLEVFRPYALPGTAWLEEVGQRLRRD